jgi:predicted enzyme related to lactoylglutathione lyase
MIKRQHSALLYSSDLNKTAEFYDKAGFPVQKSPDGVRIKMGDFTWAFIDEKETTIQNESGLAPKGLGIYFYAEVDDADEHHKSIKERGLHSTEPKTWPWGKREFVAKDPDGYKIVFYSPAK